jgi:hypothetical protein
MKKPDPVEVDNDSTDTPDEVDEPITVKPIVSLPTLGSLPEPLRTPIVETEDAESNESLNRSSETNELSEAPLPSSRELTNAFNRQENFKLQRARYKKNPKWQAWYNGLSQREKNKTIESITQILNARANAENQQQWNTFYNTWMWGRYMGKW